MPQHAARTLQDGTAWIDFRDEDEADQWTSVNDNVMGGVSTGELAGGADAGSGVGVFHGVTSLQHNGGFASVRRHLTPGELADCQALVLVVKGDGREYQLRLRQQRSPSAIAWRHRFTPTHDWQTLTLPLTEFEPVYRGRLVKDAGALDAAAVCDIAIMIADGQAGPFRLALQQITRHG
jgi:monofunctional biosynthetic peptidoglycan transglycosylase